MKVCFFANSSKNFDPNSGGVQRITRVLQSEFENKNIDVCFLSKKNKNQKVQYRYNEFVLPSDRVDDIKNIQFLKNLVDKQNIDIFINQDGFNSETLNLIKTINTHVKIISAHHNCIMCLYEKYKELFEFNRSKFFFNLVESTHSWWLVMLLYRLRQYLLWKKMLRYSDSVVIYFESFRKELKELTGIESDKIIIIPNPAPFEVKKNSNTINKKIVYVGRIIKNQKRIDILLELWKRLHKDFPDWQFDLVGDGNYMNEAKDFIKFNNLDRIKIHGKQNPLKFWDQSDIFTLTSDFEGYGMVLIEAQARGTVPVTFDCFSAIGEVVENNSSGIILNKNTVDEAYKAVKSLINNKEKLLELKENGGTQVKKFDKDNIAKKWISLFEKI